MNFVQAREDLPLLDHGTLGLGDRSARTRLGQVDVSVVVWGEFGRTPQINDNNSRDHWPQVNAACMAGGGMRTGQVIGETNRYGEEPDQAAR